MDEKLKDQDVLLVKEKDDYELKAVSGIDKNGKLNTVEANAENSSQFMKFDRSGNALENFMSNFLRQAKNPTQFQLFKVRFGKFEKMKEGLEELLFRPHIPENKEMLKQYEVNPNNFSVKQPVNAIDESRIDPKQLERLGISLETLEKTGNLEKLLNRQKTDLLPINLKLDELTLRTDARLSLREMPDGKLTVSIHALRKAPDLQRPYFGVHFTDEDKQNLLKTGNLGRIIEAEFKPGEKTPVVLSIDKQTNELVAVRADKIKVPEHIKGVALNEQQKKELSEGKAVYLENMMSKKNTPFSAYLQFNTDKRGFEFRFDTDNKHEQNQKQQHTPNDVPKTFRKKALTEEQQSSLKEGKTVYVDGLTDKNGKGYSGYVTLNKENGKLDFMFPKAYKEAVAAGKAIPDDRHKTQVAKNNEGTTTEATKNIKEPLDEGQTQPTEKQAEQQKENKPKKGIKM